MTHVALENRFWNQINPLGDDFWKPFQENQSATYQQEEAVFEPLSRKVRMSQSSKARARRTNAKAARDAAKARILRSALQLSDAGNTKAAKFMLRQHEIIPPASLRDRLGMTR